MLKFRERNDKNVNIDFILWLKIWQMIWWNDVDVLLLTRYIIYALVTQIFSKDNN